MDVWALISVSDKSGIETLAKRLVEKGLKLLATSSTAQYLQQNGLAVTTVESLTGFGEILDGRVKTLHPLIYAGLLASSDAQHQRQREELGAPDIRVVVVNLYPFEERARQTSHESTLIEEIDIGGVSLIRAAAKNFERIAVLVAPHQYEGWSHEWLEKDAIAIRRDLAVQAFDHVAYYDGVIAATLRPSHQWPRTWALAGQKVGALRYGENPHQSGAFYRLPEGRGLAEAEILQGKALSYNNYADVDTAVTLAYEFQEPAAAVIKHQTPCAVALADTVEEAYQRAHDADPVSIFGGVVAFNRPITSALARHLTEIFLEVVIAPEVSDEAGQVLAKKKNLRVLTIPQSARSGFDIKGIWGGFLIQTRDQVERLPQSWTQVAGPALEAKIGRDLELAWRTVARVKSNAIVVAKGGVTLGIGGGQTNRIDAARQALERAGREAKGAVLASDGFFPFDDVMRLAQECGIAVVVEPGGSIRDQESIDVAERAGVTLLMTGERHFRH